jgi:hypothetical protein
MSIKNNASFFKYIQIIFWILILKISFIQVGVGQCSMSCDDKIQISLNQNCEAKVTYGMILRDGDNPYVCSPNGPSAYKVVVMDEEGTPIPTSPTITCDYIGRTLMVKVKHWFSGNSCWSTVVVEDKLPPIIESTPVELWCSQDSRPESEGGMAPMPTITDACGQKCNDLTMSYEDKEVQKFSCEDPAAKEGIIAQMIRTWTACDGFGNCQTKDQVINFLMPNLEEIAFPASLTGETAIACDACDPSDLNCTGQPTLHHLSLENTLCEFNIEYKDSLIRESTIKYTINRIWTIRNTCTEETRQKVQLIDIVDNSPPAIICDNSNTAVVAFLSDTPSCMATLSIPPAIISDNCTPIENIEVTTSIYKIEEATNEKTLVAQKMNVNGGFDISVELGNYEIHYEAKDESGNTSNNIANPCTVAIRDEQVPIPVCEELTRLSLDKDGLGIIYAESFDDGSYDNCCLDRFEVRRLGIANSKFGEYVSFSCQDIANDAPLLVLFRVYDCNGNFNDCEVEVLIKDQRPPKISNCQDTITLNCDKNLSIEEIQNTHLVQPIAEDSCSGNLQYQAVLLEDQRSDCGMGYIRFEWQVLNSNSNEPATCEQIVYIKDETPVNIIFPGNYFNTVCKNIAELVPANTGMPRIEGSDCESFEITYTDSAIEGDSSCTTFIRKWTVTNLCTATGAPTIIEGEQNIHIEDTDAPILDCGGDYFEVCIDETSCTRAVEVPGISVSDCSNNVEISAKWRFMPSDSCPGEALIGIIKDASNGFKTIELGPGELFVDFFAVDPCGNRTVCNQVYRIKNCTPLELYCLPGVTLNLDGDGLVEIWASDFYQEVIDNCTDCNSEGYIFSFTQDTSEQVRFYDCLDLGLKTVDIWVTDAFGNQGSCTASFVIKGASICDTLGMNNGAATDLAGIGGNIIKENGKAVESVMVSVQNDADELMEQDETDNRGQYGFRLQKQSNVMLKPTKDDDVLNGVSTFDILQIRKHILGREILDSPYQLIAADINHSNTITTADVIALRKVLLQVETSFPNNTSWRFIRSDYEFENPTNPFEGQMPENAWIEDLDNTQEIDFIAIKIGDLNGSALGVLPSFNQTNAENRNQVNFHISQKAALQEGTQLVDFALTKTSIQALQFTLKFDPKQVEIISIPTTDQVKPSNFGTSYMQRGYLTFSWEALEERREAFHFQLLVKTNSSLAAKELFKINSKITPAKAFDASGNVYQLGTLAKENKYDYKLFQNRPNPFRHQTTIYFTLPAKSQGKLTIFNHMGQRLKTFQGTFESGKNELLIDNLHHKGVLYYQLETTFGTQMQKMIQMN